MTTRKPSADPARPRVRRSDPQGPGPIRSSSARAHEADSDDLGISEAAAAAVKEGYDVIAENIREGRLAAKRFRDGKYNISEAPGDIEEMSLRVLGLARELTETSFDVCERLLKLVGSAPAKRAREDLPAFRRTATKAGSTPARPSDDLLKLTVRFGENGAKASSHTSSLSRPKNPTAPDQISAAPLVRRGADREQISGVKFAADLAVGGLIATVTIPAGQALGVYSGLVYAESQPAPLGVLTIEVIG